jgi:hypothetical protein
MACRSTVILSQWFLPLFSLTIFQKINEINLSNKGKSTTWAVVEDRGVLLTFVDNMFRGAPH